MSDLTILPGHLIRRLHQISVAHFTHRMLEAGLDLTSVQFAALMTLRDHPDLDQQTLAGLIAYDRVTIGGVIDRLVQKGLVLRDTSADDRRARVLSLCPEGALILERAMPWVDRVQDDLVEALAAPERAMLIDLLRKATEAGNGHSRAPLKRARRKQERTGDAE